MRIDFSFLRFSTSLLATIALVACSPPSRFQDDVVDGSTDGMVTDIPTGTDVLSIDIPDTSGLSRTCLRAAQCDDGIECTEDACNMGRCENIPNSGRCDDMVYCNGIESCDSRRGCLIGTVVNCTDNEVCTSDRCDERTRACVHNPLDRDGDGDPDDHCRDRTCGDGGVIGPGVDAGRNDAGMLVCWVGADCDDSNPRVSSQLPEICDDRIDNNCNGLVDMAEPGGCRRAAHDRCDDPLDVSRGGAFTLDVSATPSDYVLSCARGLGRDVVARIRLDAPRDVRITAQADGGAAAIALQSVCGGAAPMDTIDCNQGFPARVRRHSLPAGDYFVIVATSVRTTVELDVQITPATPAATNDLCANAVEIPEAMGGVFRSDLVGINNETLTRCGGGARDAFFRLELTSPKNVQLQLAGGRTDNLILSLIDRCAVSPNTLKCDSGSNVSFTNYSLPAGVYYVVVESFDPVDYTLTATITPPTPPPAGDTCANPIDLVAGRAVTVATSLLENDYAPSCFNQGRDAVLRFTLAERQDVVVTATGGANDFLALALHSECPVMRFNERSCSTGLSTVRSLALSLDPGTYFLTLKSSRPSDISVRLDSFAPAVVQAPMGNDTCATATPIMANRALYRGTTANLTHDYRGSCAASNGRDGVFTFTLAAPQHVLLLVDTAFLNVVYLTGNDACPGAPIAARVPTCQLGTRSAIDVDLPAGTYYFFVDGLADSGPYTFYFQAG